MLLISAREIYMFSHGTPNDPSFAQPWIQTAPFVFPLILFSATEAFLRPSRQYKDSTRIALAAGGVLCLVSTLIIAVFCLPAQVRVQWAMPNVKDLMITYQVINGSAALWMSLAFVLYRYMPVPWMPPGLQKHIALFACYTGVESADALINNYRIPIDKTHLPLVVCLCYITLFYFWLRIQLGEFKQGGMPPPSSHGKLEEARTVVSELSRRLEEGHEMRKLS